MDYEPTVVRPFKVPGNLTTQWIISVVCFLVIAQAVVLFIFPQIFSGVVDWAYTGPVLVGVILTVGVGEYILNLAIANKAKEALKINL